MCNLQCLYVCIGWERKCNDKTRERWWVFGEGRQKIRKEWKGRRGREDEEEKVGKYDEEGCGSE